MMAAADLLPLLLFVVGCLAVMALWEVRRRRVRQLLGEAFDALRITDGDRPLRGRDLTLVAERRQVQVQLRKDYFGRSSPNDPRAEYYLYCVGPGPSWFLAIALVNDPGWWSGSHIDIDWVVRPLDAERMRGALVGDDDALRAAGLAADT